VNPSPELLHFLRLACTGSESYASSGEVRSHRLAQVALENVGALDGRAAAGFAEFVQVIRTGGEMVLRQALRKAGTP